MFSNQLLAPLPVADAYLGAPAVSLDADFDARWAAWVARGRAHDEIVRRTLGMYGGALAIATAILYVFVGSWLPR